MTSLNILCFGDSLTAGYSNYGMQFTPYGDHLKDQLKAAWPNTYVNITVNGKSGDLVSSPGQFKARLESQLMAATERFNFIIILGGTNDLGYGRSAETLISALDDIYTLAHDHGANILALTIPECHAKSQALDMKRNIVNEDILNTERRRFFTLDLFFLMPYHSMAYDEKEKVWDDGLHFTALGYERIGEHVASRLVEIVEEVGMDAAKNEKRLV